MDAEILWRKELIARLQAPKNVLIKKSAREQEAIDTVDGQYQTLEDAQEAFGWGDITVEDFDRIREQIKSGEKAILMTPARLALDELQNYIGRLKGEIKYFEWEMLPAEEQARREQNHEQYKKDLRKRANHGWLAELERAESYPWESEENE